MQLDDDKNDKIYFESIKPINFNHTLAIVSSIKLPEGVNVNITTNHNQAATNTDKPKISHGKPNYTMPRKKSNHSAVNQTTCDKFVKETSSSSEKQHPQLSPPRATKQISNEPVKQAHVTVSSTLPSPLPVKLQSKQSTSAGAQKPILTKEANESRKLLISHGKPNFIAPAKIQQHQPKQMHNQTTTKDAVENYLEVKIKSLKPQRSIDESSSLRLLEKKAMFEKPSPSNPFANAMKSLKTKETNKSTSANSNDIQRALNRLRSTDRANGPNYKPLNYSGQNTPHSDCSNDSGHSSPLPQPSYINKTAFEQHVTDAVKKNIPDGRKTSSSNNTTNFEQKTFVSFSKELNDSPNRYPEHVHVTKTISSSTETMTSYRRQEAVFDNIRFSINDQAQVIHKLKH